MYRIQNTNFRESQSQAYSFLILMVQSQNQSETKEVEILEAGDDVAHFREIVNAILCFCLRTAKIELQKQSIDDNLNDAQTWSQKIALWNTKVKLFLSKQYTELLLSPIQHGLIETYLELVLIAQDTLKCVDFKGTTAPLCLLGFTLPSPGSKFSRPDRVQRCFQMRFLIYKYQLSLFIQ